jgi:hypothetical protein
MKKCKVLTLKVGSKVKIDVVGKITTISEVEDEVGKDKFYFVQLAGHEEESELQFTESELKSLTK